MVEVDHLNGKVVNILRDFSPTRIDFVEFKRRCDATFVNEFIPEGEGMRYQSRLGAMVCYRFCLVCSPGWVRTI